MPVKLSIITATWNSAETLPATLDSLAAQTCQDFESIVVDGGSSDSTVDIIKASEVVDRWVSEKDRGIYDALNKGIQMAQGEYVGFMHSDDIFADNASVEIILDYIEKHSPDAVYADLNYVQKDDVSKVVRHWKSGKYDASKLKWGWMPPHPTFYMKKSLYENFGLFDLSYKIAADYDSLMRYLFVGGVVPAYISEVLVKMRVGGASNRSLKNIIQKSKEDIRVMRASGIPVFKALVGKNLTKIPQFFKK
ncbi:glycosyltransferase family 2 protein [Marinagarivorans cellulosilyticus]|uniref:Glycosyltransferase n=1 Tax=Marinagarivorans cellulosilyticus TaxID=2721545 RepID=A0AAN1WIS3_9GAMM|nr:glycosyltransferase family 2 protein [Marinagarivorans cellulosilyticus]BCD98339.1 glycosyltransferase [Marinagarivorans cellulosilyticus]